MKDGITHIDLTLAHEVLTNEAESILHARDRLDDGFIKAIDLLANCIENGGKVVVTGVGKSGKVASKVAATLSSTGTLAVFLHPTEAAHGDLGIVTAKDALLCFSQSGSSDEVTRLLPHLRRLGVPIIVVAGKSNSPLATAAHAYISSAIQTEACPHNLAPTSSTTVAIAIGDAMALCLSRRWNFDADKFAALHPAGALGRRLTWRVSDLMHKESAIGQVTPQTPIEEVVAVLTKTALGAVFVSNDKNELLGLITDGDIRRALQKRDEFFNLTAERVMTKNPTCVTPQTLAQDALKLMENRPSQISVLPVLSGEEHSKRAVGLVRLHDLIGQL